MTTTRFFSKLYKHVRLDKLGYTNIPSYVKSAFRAESSPLFKRASDINLLSSYFDFHVIHHESNNAVAGFGIMSFLNNFFSPSSINGWEHAVSQIAYKHNNFTLNPIIRIFH